jgi:hypothetical protein
MGEDLGASIGSSGFRNNDLPSGPSRLAESRRQRLEGREQQEFAFYAVDER